MRERYTGEIRETEAPDFMLLVFDKLVKLGGPERAVQMFRERGNTEEYISDLLSRWEDWMKSELALSGKGLN